MQKRSSLPRKRESRKPPSYLPLRAGKGIPACAGMTNNNFVSEICINPLVRADADRLDDLAPFYDFGPNIFAEISRRAAERLGAECCERLIYISFTQDRIDALFYAGNYCTRRVFRQQHAVRRAALLAR